VIIANIATLFSFTDNSYFATTTIIFALAVIADIAIVVISNQIQKERQRGEIEGRDEGREADKG
jgi:hypothetical protein